MQTAKKQQKNSKQLVHWISNLWLVKNLISMEGKSGRDIMPDFGVFDNGGALPEGIHCIEFSDRR